MSRNYPTNTDDIIDSRDIIRRIDELVSERMALVDAITEAEEAVANASNDDEAEEASENLSQAKADLDGWLEADELKALQDLADEASSCSDWQHGETLIRDDYFEDYARQLADDIGAISSDDAWPATCIDWEKAASELQMDYTSVDFDGVTYWIRS